MRQLARIVLITAGMIWGIGFIGNKYILDSGWTDLQLLFVRFVSAYLFMLIFFLPRILKAKKDTIKQGLFLGIFLFFGYFFQTWGLEYTTPSNNAIITAGYIIILPVIVFFFDKVNIPRFSIIAALITMIGIVIISIDFSSFSINIGDLLTFIGAFFWAIHLYYLSHQSKKHDLFALLGFQLLIFSVLITSLMFLIDGFPSITSGIDQGYNLYLIAILLGFFASFLAFIMQAFGQKHTSPTEASILISTESVFGPMFAILFYTDKFTIPLLIGTILVFIGILVSELKPGLRKEI